MSVSQLALFKVNTLRDNFLLRFSSVILSSSLAFELRHLYQRGDAFLPMLPSDYRPLLLDLKILTCPNDVKASLRLFNSPQL